MATRTQQERRLIERQEFERIFCGFDVSHLPRLLSSR